MFIEMLCYFQVSEHRLEHSSGKCRLNIFRMALKVAHEAAQLPQSDSLFSFTPKNRYSLSSSGTALRLPLKAVLASMWRYIDYVDS